MAVKPLQLPQTVSLEGTQDGDKRAALPIAKPSVTAATAQRCTLRRLRMGKHRILAPDIWGAHQRNDFSEPSLLHLPIHRKTLNSWTWDVWFSLINSNLLKFQVPGLCCKDSYMPWLLPYIFRAVPQSYPRDCVLGLSPQFCPPNKTYFSPFRLCFFFFQSTPTTCLVLAGPRELKG